MKSDVVPAIDAGSWGVHVPHGLTWSLEHAEPPVDQPRFRELEHLGELPGLVEEIGENQSRRVATPSAFPAVAIRLVQREQHGALVGGDGEMEGIAGAKSETMSLREPAPVLK